MAQTGKDCRNSLESVLEDYSDPSEPVHYRIRVIRGQVSDPNRTPLLPGADSVDVELKTGNGFLSYATGEIDIFYGGSVSVTVIHPSRQIIINDMERYNASMVEQNIGQYLDKATKEFFGSSQMYCRTKNRTEYYVLTANLRAPKEQRLQKMEYWIEDGKIKRHINHFRRGVGISYQETKYLHEQRPYRPTGSDINVLKKFFTGSGTIRKQYSNYSIEDNRASTTSNTR